MTDLHLSKQTITVQTFRDVSKFSSVTAAILVIGSIGNTNNYR